MSIVNVTMWIECDGGCGWEIEIDPIEMADGTWGDSEDTELPEGWVRIPGSSADHEHYCAECARELELENE